MELDIGGENGNLIKSLKLILVGIFKIPTDGYHNLQADCKLEGDCKLSKSL